MKDLTKMMIFMFLGLVLAILVLGFHKSPATTAHRSTSSPTVTSPSTGVPPSSGNEYSNY